MKLQCLILLLAAQAPPATAAAPEVAVYRNDAGASEEGGVGRYARLMVDSLERLGLGHEVLDDKAVAAGRLAGEKVAILPLNPVLPAPAAEQIRKFVAAGGKLLVCYRLPAPLGELLGLGPGGAIDGRDGRLDAISFQGREDRPKVRDRQHSWIARRILPAKGTKVVGHWLDQAGRRSDLPAVTRNENGYFVGHVLTGHDPGGQDRLLLEMLGQLWPEAWKKVYQHRLGRISKVAGLGGVKELTAAALAGAEKAGRTERVARMLSAADALVADAKAIAEYGDFVQASETIAEAHHAYRRAFAASVASRPGEFRGVWCHSPTGVRGMSWEEALEALSSAGFNAILPNMCWGSGAAYPSEVLPRVSAGAGRDLLAECLAAAKKHGIAVHVWRVNWRLWGDCPEALRRQLEKAGRLQRDAKGKTLPWLCPSHPENQKLELDSMLEIVRRYDVAGIHFDYIRYPGPQGCYCPGCRRRFEERYDVRVKDWPAEVRTGPLRWKYLQFRRDNITSLVAAVAERARQIRPGVLISAAVFWRWPGARDDVGQDWKLWVERGYLDFVCPMQYVTDHAEFARRTRLTRAWAAGRAAVMPGIGATLGLAPDAALRQVLIAREQKAAGFVLFNYDRSLAERHLPLLGLGATAEKTTWERPRRGIISTRPR